MIQFLHALLIHPPQPPPHSHTQRLSTVKQCDTIVVLEKGVIAEAGTHEELWTMNGVYRRLAAAQEKEAI